MKKKLIGVAVVAAIAVTAGWNYNQSKNEMKMSDLALANVEALAINEGNNWAKCYLGGCVNAIWSDCWLYEFGYPSVFCPDAWNQ